MGIDRKTPNMAVLSILAIWRRPFQSPHFTLSLAAGNDLQPSTPAVQSNCVRPSALHYRPSELTHFSSHQQRRPPDRLTGLCEDLSSVDQSAAVSSQFACFDYLFNHHVQKGYTVYQGQLASEYCRLITPNLLGASLTQIYQYDL